MGLSREQSVDVSDMRVANADRSPLDKSKQQSVATNIAILILRGIQYRPYGQPPISIPNGCIEWAFKVYVKWQKVILY